MADPQQNTAGTPAVVIASDAKQSSVQGTQTATQTGAQDAALDAKAAKLQEALKKFTIPPLVKEKFPEMIPLIIETESMNDDERQYWFSILPIMTEEQVVKLREILMNEKIQLQKLDADYAKDLTKMNEKHMSQWKEIEIKEKWNKIHSAEKSAEEEEKSQEEAILQELDQA